MRLETEYREWKRRGIILVIARIGISDGRCY
jgi:hypothetical protein